MWWHARKKKKKRKPQHPNVQSASQINRLYVMAFEPYALVILHSLRPDHTTILTGWCMTGNNKNTMQNPRANKATISKNNQEVVDISRVIKVCLQSCKLYCHQGLIKRCSYGSVSSAVTGDTPCVVSEGGMIPLRWEVQIQLNRPLHFNTVLAITRTW